MYPRTPKTIARFCRVALPEMFRSVDGRRTLNWVAALLETDRPNSFSGFRETARRVAGFYEAVGAEAEVHSVPTGGPIGSGRWVVTQAQDTVAARLRVVKPVNRDIADFADNPFHAVQWSSATPPEGLAAELFVLDDVQKLEDIPAGRIRGRFVLSRAPHRQLFEPLAKHGALGIIFDKPVPEHPNAVAWSKFGWGGVALENAGRRLVGMAVSESQGKLLRKLCAEHDHVTVRVQVDVRPYVGSHDVVSGIVRGRDNPQDEVWALAHCYEPGAHDNSSGLAVCIEAARIIDELAEAGMLPRPRRTIRLLSGYECYGFFHYLEHVRRLQTPLAGVCIDCVGALPRCCGGAIEWHDTIPMSAGFVDRVGSAIIKASLGQRNPGYRLLRKPFVSTCDTLIGDPKYGFPCPWLTTYAKADGKPYDAYHSSADTVGLLGVRAMELCAVAMAGYLYYLADAGTDEVMDLASAETRWALRALQPSRKRIKADRAEYLRERHRVSLYRLQRWMWGGDRPAVLQLLGECQREVAAAGPKARSRKAAGDRRTPRRTAPLTPTLENTTPEIARKIREAGLLDRALFWADGERDVAQIAQVLGCEVGKEQDEDKVAGFFDAHAELGYVEMIEPGDVLTRAQLVRDLKALGLKSGMDVMVHSSLSSIGHVRGGPEAVIDALLRVIGRRGTLLLPSFNHSAARVFNPLATPTTNGAIPDAGWRRPDAVRSLHPSHSVAAIGQRANEYCEGHLEAGIWGAESPIGRLVHWGGYILSLGVGHGATTAQHVAEVSIPCPCIDQTGKREKVVDEDGQVREVGGLVWRNATCPVPIAKMDRSLDRRKLQTRGKVGNADAILVKAADLYRVRREHLRRVCPTCKIRPAYA